MFRIHLEPAPLCHIMPLIVSALIVLMAAGSGGISLSCNKICLKDLKRFHRVKLECGDLKVDIEETGPVVNSDVTFDNVTRCITRKSGILMSCSVMETKNYGRKTPVSFTYNCAQVPDTSTAPAPTTGNLTLTTPALIPGNLPLTAPAPVSSTEGHKRHHICAIVAGLPVIFLVLYLCCLNYFQRSYGLKLQS